MTNVRRFLPYAKAGVAGLSALIGGLATITADGSITAAEVAGLIFTVVAASAATWRVPNKAA